MLLVFRMTNEGVRVTTVATFTVLHDQCVNVGGSLSHTHRHTHIGHAGEQVFPLTRPLSDMEEGVVLSVCLPYLTWFTLARTCRR